MKFRPVAAGFTTTCLQAIDVSEKSGVAPLLVVIRCIPCQARCAGLRRAGGSQGMRAFAISWIDLSACASCRATRSRSGTVPVRQRHVLCRLLAERRQDDLWAVRDDGQSRRRARAFAGGLSPGLGRRAGATQDYPNNRQSLAGKRGPAPRFKVPEAYPRCSAMGPSSIMRARWRKAACIATRFGMPNGPSCAPKERSFPTSCCIPGRCRIASA